MTVTFTAEQVKALAEQGILGTATKHDPSTAAAGYPLQGVTGAPLSEPALRPGIPNAILSPYSPLDGLQLSRSEYVNEKITIFTAQTATQGSNPTDACGTPAYPGNLKKATTTRTFGQMFIGSRTYDITEAGLLTNRAEIGHRLINDPLMQSPLMPDILRRPGLDTRSLRAQQMFEMGIAVDRALAGVTMDGASTNTGASAELGFLQEFDGFSALVKTGYVDESTSVAAPAMDSTVVTWSGSFQGTVGGKNMVETLTELYWSKSDRATRLGVTGVQWRLVMDSRLFYQLAYLFATTYASTRYDLVNSAAQPINRDVAETEARFEQFINGRFLTIMGQRIPVFFSPNTDTTLTGGSLQGDLYLIPERFSGGPITYLEYFPMDNQYLGQFLTEFNSTDRVVTNNGLYVLAERSDALCSQIVASARMRLMLDMPFLAGRIDDIDFPSHIGYRDWNPAGSSFAGGGVSYYTA